jgi:ketosteroid isomerase-like protein
MVSVAAIAALDSPSANPSPFPEVDIQPGWRVDTARVGRVSDLPPLDELRRRHAREREAHLNRDADLMASLFADDFVSVQDGEVTRPTREASRQRFERYFSRVTFLAWDDEAEPVVDVSEDGTLATILVRKRVHVAYRDDDGQPAEEETHFAWVEVWRRRDERWELTMVASTKRLG